MIPPIFMQILAWIGVHVHILSFLCEDTGDGAFFWVGGRSLGWVVREEFDGYGLRHIYSLCLVWFLWVILGPGGGLDGTNLLQLSFLVADYLHVGCCMRPLG